VTDTDTVLIVAVPIAQILDLLPLHPYESPAWDCPPFTIADVLKCTDPNPGMFDHWTSQPDRTADRRLHIARIAYLARTWPNDGSDAPWVEMYCGVTMLDGWHRFAAAIARGERTLHIDLSGDLNEAVECGLLPKEPS
jgi:hypothetical protein